jgi:hypothetical protein
MAAIVAGAVAANAPMREGEVSLFRPQAEIFQASTKIELAVAGIGGGKTMLGALKTLTRAIQVPTRHDQCHAVISPTFPMSKLGPEPKLLELLSDERIFPVSPLVDHARADRCLFVLNALGRLSKIRIFSGEFPDRWRGDEWLSAWLDEGDYLAKYGWTVALGRLARTNGHALITTSPNGHGWVFDEAEKCTIAADADGYQKRTSPDGQRLLVHWTSLFNPFVSAAGYEILRDAYDEDTYRQEILGEFVAKSGRVYKAFDRARHVTDRVPFKRDQRVYVGQDFNVERMCSTITQETPGKSGRGGLHVHDELELRDADTFKLVATMRDWCRRKNVRTTDVVFCPDASGRKRQTTGSDTSRSDIRILEQGGFRVQVGGSNPLVKDRVNCVNGLFANDRLTISSHCSKTLEAIEKQAWDTESDPVVPIKDGILDNRTDSLGYACWAKYPLRRETIIGKAA